MLMNITKMVVGYGLGAAASSVMGQVFNTVLPKAVTVTEKAVRVVGCAGVGVAISYGAQKWTDDMIDCCADLCKVFNNKKKVEDKVVVD